MREPDALLRHLRYAEEWVRWARSDYRRGDVHGAVLRLLLAEAEVRHAREAGSQGADDVPARSFRRPGVVTTVGALAVAAMLAATAYNAFLSGAGPRRRAASPGAPVVRMAPTDGASWGAVRLDSGDFLTLISSGRDASSGGLGAVGEDARVSDQRFVDELMFQFGQIAPTSASEP
ncbi:MAG TPA: hypothetical protein VEP50_19915, partial [bacterium]|nr:hypothetical protein [bacterium]